MSLCLVCLLVGVHSNRTCSLFYCIIGPWRLDVPLPACAHISLFWRSPRWAMVPVFLGHVSVWLPNVPVNLSRRGCDTSFLPWNLLLAGCAVWCALFASGRVWQTCHNRGDIHPSGGVISIPLFLRLDGAVEKKNKWCLCVLSRTAGFTIGPLLKW